MEDSFFLASRCFFFSIGVLLALLLDAGAPGMRVRRNLSYGGRGLDLTVSAEGRFRVTLWKSFLFWAYFGHDSRSTLQVGFNLCAESFEHRANLSHPFLHPFPFEFKAVAVMNDVPEAAIRAKVRSQRFIEKGG